VFAAGARPVIIEPQAWMDTAYAPQVRASIAAHDPGSRSWTTTKHHHHQPEQQHRRVGAIDMNTAWSRTETHDPTDWDAAYDVAATTHRSPLPPPPASQDEPAPTPAQPDILTADTDTTDTDAAQEPMFPTLEEWVTGYLAPIITTELGPGLRWCAQWWRHAAAIAVLEATWRAWEHLRTAEDGVSWR
jgi:hypothetical protein